MRKADLDKLLNFAVQKDASDIHLSAGNPPILRIHGTLRRLENTEITSSGLRSVIAEILSEKQRQTLEENLELDFAYAIPNVARFRTNLFFQLRGEAAAFRTIPDRIRPLNELRAPKGIHKLCRERNGIILVTGPTGSGKTTVGQVLAERFGWELIDGDHLHPPANIQKMSRGEPLNDEDRRPWLEHIRSEIDRFAEPGCGAIVVCSALKASYRHRLLAGAQRVALVWLHGDFDLILGRLQARQGH
ncbi:Flp pilus assembly complex ATPase component TadA, partial [candidate division KSB1 bacterium]|nr:Flp pilus assembly complex ATPase component TadA [candidate division KSB1 bacterium]